MKKKAVLSSIAIALIAFLFAGYAFAAAATGALSLEKVRELALEKVPGGLVTDIDYEKRSNTTVYEIEIYKDGMEHDLVIDAKTGKELSYHKEKDDDYYLYAQQAESAASTTFITEAKAKEIALQKAGGSSAKIVEFEFEYDDGHAVYDGDIVDGEKKYSFKINAVSGELLKWDPDGKGKAKAASAAAPGVNAGDAGSGTTAVGDIGKEKAKIIALDKVNVAGAKVTHIERERDDGRIVYEGEIRAGDYEYDFEIDAQTGKIVEWEKERWDD